MRYDALAPRKDTKSGKTYWQKVGAMFVGNDGEAYMILSTYPLPNREDGQIHIVFKQPDSEKSPSRRDGEGLGGL